MPTLQSPMAGLGVAGRGGAERGGARCDAGRCDACDDKQRINEPILTEDWPCAVSLTADALGPSIVSAEYE